MNKFEQRTNSENANRAAFNTAYVLDIKACLNKARKKRGPDETSSFSDIIT